MNYGSKMRKRNTKHSIKGRLNRGVDRVGRYLGRKDPKVILMLAGAVSAVSSLFQGQSAQADTMAAPASLSNTTNILTSSTGTTFTGNIALTNSVLSVGTVNYVVTGGGGAPNGSNTQFGTTTLSASTSVVVGGATANSSLGSIVSTGNTSNGTGDAISFDGWASITYGANGPSIGTQYYNATNALKTNGTNGLGNGGSSGYTSYWNQNSNTGVWRCSSWTAAGTGGSGTVIVEYMGPTAAVTGGTVAAGGTSTAYAKATMNSSTTLTRNSNNVVTFSGILSGTTGLTLAGAGTFNFTNSGNSYTGNTIINSGVTLNLDSGGRLNSGNYANNITINGALGFDTAVQTFSGAVTQSANSYTGLTVSGGTLTLSGTANNTNLVGNLTAGELDLGKSAASVQAFNKLTVAGGLAKVTDATANQVLALTINSGAYDLNGYTQASDTSVAIALNGGSLKSDTGSGAWNSGVTLGSNSTSIGGAGNLSLSGNITGSYAFNKDGAGDVILTGGAGQVAYTTVNVNNGAVQLDGSADDQLQTASVVTLGDASNAGKLILGGSGGARNQQLDALTVGVGGGSVVGGNASVSTLTLGNNSIVTNTFNGVLGGVGANDNNLALVKTGTNKVVLNGVNTYTGSTQVNNGILLVGDATHTGASLDSAVTIGSTGTLGGHGTFNGSVTAASGGKFAPGGSIGTSTINAGLDLSAGGIFEWELGAYSTSNPGTDWDQAIVTGGNLALGGTSQFDVQFLTIGSPNGGNSFWNSTHQWKVIDVTTGTNTGDTNFNSLLNATYTKGHFETVVGTGADAGDIFLNYVLDISTTTYTLAAAPSTLDILKGGQLAGTSTITNTGTGSADQLDYSTLSGTSSDTLVATVAGSASSPPPLDNAGGTATANLLVTGVDYGTATVTASVSTATNTNIGGDATFSGPAGTIAVLVGNATADKNNSRNSFTGNSLGAVVANGAKMADFSLGTILESKVVTTTGSGGADALGSTATILNSENVTQDMTVAMTWRTRTTPEEIPGTSQNPPINASLTPNVGLISDVVRLSGMAKTGGTVINGTSGVRDVETNIFVLQMSYTASEIVAPGTELEAFLGWLDPGLDGLIGTTDDLWRNAVAGNIVGGVMTESNGNFVGDVAYSNTYFVLGDWGVDTTNNVVWAVINHQGDFAAIPEPGSLSLLGLGALGLLGRRRRKDRKKAANPWADRLYGRVKLN